MSNKEKTWQCVRCGRCCMHMHSDDTNMPCESLLIEDGIATCLIHGENKPDVCKNYPNHPDFGGEKCFFQRKAMPEGQTQLQTDFIFEKMQNEIDRLTAELAEARKKPESYIDVIRQIGRIACGDMEEIERLTDELKAKDEEIARLKHDIKVISECKIHCKNCNVRIEQALKVKGG